MIHELKCVVDGCNKSVKSDVPFAPFATYTCVEHNQKGPDNVHFQPYQFDQQLSRPKK